MGKFSRDKGKRTELKGVHAFHDAGFNTARRTQQYCGTEGTSDITCPELPDLHIEVKGVERLNAEEAMCQAERDSEPEKIEVVVSYKNCKKPMAFVRLDNFLEILRRSDLPVSVSVDENDD